MSHIAQVDLHIKDLSALEKACAQLGLELVREQKTYKWYGRVVGDYPLPEGFQAHELGQCEHAIRIPGNSGAYEIGVVARRDGKPGYLLLWDFWHGGFGLEERVGAECKKLRQSYAVQVATKQARGQGFRVQQHVGQDGKVRLTCSR
jgi:hypothetical protein